MPDSAEYMTARQVAQMAPGNPTSATVWRWMTRGLRVRGRGTIQLRYLRRGGRLYTTQDWVADFFAQCEPCREGEATGPVAQR